MADKRNAPGFWGLINGALRNQMSPGERAVADALAGPTGGALRAGGDLLNGAGRSLQRTGRDIMGIPAAAAGLLSSPAMAGMGKSQAQRDAEVSAAILRDLQRAGQGGPSAGAAARANALRGYQPELNGIQTGKYGAPGVAFGGALQRPDGSRVPSGRGPGAPQVAPARVVPGQAIAPGPGMGAPAAVINRPEYARAEENNRAYQQAGGRENYWDANPEMKRAVLEGPKATDVGYSDRADIQAWIKAQGGESNPMVQRFLADQERKGLIRRPDPLANAYAGGADAQVLQGQPGLGESAKQAPWNSAGQNSVFGQGDSSQEYTTDARGLAPGLGGAGALGQRNPNQVFAPTQIPGTESARGSLETAASQAPWATGAPGDLAPGIGNFKSSGEIRALNLGGSEALGSAHATQAAAIRPEVGATATEPEAPPAERPEDTLLNQYIRRIGSARANGATYAGGVISNGLF